MQAAFKESGGSGVGVEPSVVSLNSLGRDSGRWIRLARYSRGKGNCVAFGMPLASGWV